jgi:16S rRNA (guanine527-N7)-methyltransferase
MDTGVRAALERSKQLGLLGPGDVDSHIAHALQYADEIDPPLRALDLGSGGGLPGLVLAGHWPDSRWILLDVAERRCDILDRAVGRLGWRDRVEVVCSPAEAAAHSSMHRATYDLVVARSFGPLSITMLAASAFLRVGGHLVVSSRAEDEAPSVDHLLRCGMRLVRRADTWLFQQAGLVDAADPPHRLSTGKVRRDS